MIPVLPVTDPAFAAYGQVVKGYDFAPLIEELKKTPRPDDGVVYVPSVEAFEQLTLAQELSDRYYGGMPIQLGYCNGSNTKLNALEYHRDSEVDVAVQDLILLVALQPQIKDNQLDTSLVKAFLLPAGCAVELFATCLHYAPCEAKKGEGFRMCVVLPRNTNTDKPNIVAANEEDKLLYARNKWLLAHPDSPEAADAFVGLVGENIDIADQI